MHKSFGALALASLFAFAASASPTQAGVITFTSGNGTGTVCSEIQPCDIAIAISSVPSAGEILCVGPVVISVATAFNLLINKSMTLDCPVGVARGPLVIDAPGHVVVIRNLTFNSGGVPVGSPAIDFKNGRALVIENCTFINFYADTPPIAVNFRPALAGSQLTVKNSVFVNNGIGSAGGGIVVRPEGSGNARVLIEGVTVGHGIFGIAADGTGSTGGINMTISNSQISGNAQYGIVAATSAGGAPIGLLVTNTKSANNTVGIGSFGPNVTVRVESSKITGNGTGLSFGSGGALLTAGNNTVEANGSNGAFSSSYALK